MHRIATLLILLSASVPFALAGNKAEPVQIHYVVDVRHPAKRLLQIQVQIEGLPEGRTAIVFPSSKTSVANRIEQIGRQSEDGEVSTLTLEEGQLVVETSDAEPVKLVFLLRSESFQHLDRATYLDEYRCLFHLQDILLQIENQDPKVTVSFDLPHPWKAVSTVRPTMDGSYSIETKRTVPFYLGRAETALDDSDDSLLWMVIEPGWPPAPELLTSLRQQIRYRQRFARNQGSRPLLAVFLAPSRLVPNKELFAFGAPQLVAFAAAPGLAETTLAMRRIQQAMARGLARRYFPAIANFAVELSPDRLIDYLALKACLKTGILGRAEFLDALAVELWNTFGEPGESVAKPSPSGKATRTVVAPPRRTRCSGLLLDLALSFYGDATPSLDAFLAAGFRASTDEQVTEADLRKRLRQEQQAAGALAGVWQTEAPQRIGELLRPFGLLFDRRELPAFDFQLNETFQIAQLGRHTLGTTGMLETGDRIVAINNHRLMRPDDLLKCRSLLTPGQEVQLDVERRSLPLRVTQRVAREVLFRLEVNKLADADKQQKLEQFLSVESEEN